MNLEKTNKQSVIMETLIREWMKAGKPLEEIITLVSQMITEDASNELQVTISAMAVRLVLNFLIQETATKEMCDNCDSEECTVPNKKPVKIKKEDMH